MADGSELRGPLLRRLPHNVDAEVAVLGAILTNKHVYERVSEFLRPEHFVLREHEQIFRVITTLISQGKIADLVTLRDWFEQSPVLEAVGGVEYLTASASARRHRSMPASTAG